MDQVRKPGSACPARCSSQADDVAGPMGRDIESVGRRVSAQHQKSAEETSRFASISVQASCQTLAPGTSEPIPIDPPQLYRQHLARHLPEPDIQPRIDLYPAQHRLRRHVRRNTGHLHPLSPQLRQFFFRCRCPLSQRGLRGHRVSGLCYAMRHIRIIPLLFKQAVFLHHKRVGQFASDLVLITETIVAFNREHTFAPRIPF